MLGHFKKTNGSLPTPRVKKTTTHWWTSIPPIQNSQETHTYRRNSTCNIAVQSIPRLAWCPSQYNTNESRNFIWFIKWVSIWGTFYELQSMFGSYKYIAEQRLESRLSRAFAIRSSCARNMKVSAPRNPIAMMLLAAARVATPAKYPARPFPARGGREQFDKSAIV